MIKAMCQKFGIRFLALCKALSMVVELEERARNNKLLLDAIERNELVLHYQPKVDMITGQTVGVEALLRWNHPEHGVLSPGLFHLATNKQEVVIDLARWTIEEAVKQIEMWQRDGLSMRVSVNLTATELTHPEFISWLNQLFQQYQSVSPSMLELEIVESSVLENLDLVRESIVACRALGLKITLDDFGVGYSSFSHVRNLPVDKVKIDRMFVQDVAKNEADRTVVKMVMSLAEMFEMDVVAEGVESVEQGFVLLELGCRYAQGFGIARAMRGEKLPAWVKEYAPSPEWANYRIPAAQRGLTRKAGFPSPTILKEPSHETA